MEIRHFTGDHVAAMDQTRQEARVRLNAADLFVLVFAKEIDEGVLDVGMVVAGPSDFLRLTQEILEDHLSDA
jgi:hypothetical protein